MIEDITGDERPDILVVIRSAGQISADAYGVGQRALTRIVSVEGLDATRDRQQVRGECPRQPHEARAFGAITSIALSGARTACGLRRFLEFRGQGGF